MGYYASSIATIPREDFEWWVLLLEDTWRDGLRQELAQNFEVLSKQVGRNVLVVRGFDPDDFVTEAARILLDLSDAVLETPAILITSISPSDLVGRNESPPGLQLILLPLRARYQEAGSTINIMREVVAAVRNPDATDALQNPDYDMLRRYWGWIPKYLELKPNFMGFGINLNVIMDEFFSRPNSVLNPRPALDQPPLERKKRRSFFRPFGRSQ